MHVASPESRLPMQSLAAQGHSNAPLQRDAQESRSAFSTTAFHIDLSVDISIHEAPLLVSPLAVVAIHHISQSSINGESKQQLTSLVAFIDEHVPHGKKEKLLKDIIAIVSLMEQSQDTHSNTSFTDLWLQYLQERQEMREATEEFSLDLSLGFYSTNITI